MKPREKVDFKKSLKQSASEMPLIHLYQVSLNSLDNSYRVEDFDYSPIKIKSKKHAEMACKFVDIDVLM